MDSPFPISCFNRSFSASLLLLFALSSASANISITYVGTEGSGESRDDPAFLGAKNKFDVEF